MAALDDIEDVDMEDDIKMEVFSDGEEILEPNSETIDDYDIDPLLTLTPIIYTTKIDQMHIVNQNLKDLNPKEILNMIMSESKPELTAELVEPPPNSENIQSYIKLASVLQQLNLKAKMHGHSVYVRNLKLWNQCQPCSIVLEDIKHTILANKKIEASNHSQTESATNDASYGIGVQVKIEPVEEECFSKSETDEVQVKKEATEELCDSNSETDEVQVKKEATEELCDSNSETDEVQVKKEVDIPWADIKTVVRAVAIETIDISDTETSETNKPLPRSKAIENEMPSPKTAKPIQLQHKNVEIVSSAKKIKPIEDLTKSTTVPSNNKTETNKRSHTSTAEFSEEDNTALIKLKRKPVATATTPIPPRDIPLAFEKYAIIILIHRKKQAYVYRANFIKLISDYFITTEYEECNLIAMYPREEKISEHYCCWLKREEAIKKICTRKCFPFTIQKFMSQPHNCNPGDCKCCCFTKKRDSKQSKISKEQLNVNKSDAVAESWIRGLLERNQSGTISLVRKALNYIPKVQVKEKSIAKESEKYLENVLLWMKNIGLNNYFNNVPELYEIGKNGIVVRSYIIDKSEKCHHLLRTYQLMGLETLKTEFCCWYKRDKLLMTNLRMGKVSPTALKSIQVSHVCARNNCKCCCKPRVKPLTDFETLPATIKHTSAYEKTSRPLVIRFNVKSYVANKKVQQSNTKTSTGTISSTDEKKNKDIDNLSATILNKFKNLNLGVNSDGKLEVVLKAPARHISVAELKVLSDILAFSTKQITKLKISPRKLCDRIKSKSGQANDDIAPEVAQISTPEIELPIIALTEIIPPSSVEQNMEPPSPEIPIPVTTPNIDSSKKCSHILYTSMANSLEMQNKSYTDSFKSFYDHFASLNNMVLETAKLPPAVNALKKTAPIKPIAMPKIVNTFTLTKSPLSTPPIDINGTSDSTLQAQFSRTKHKDSVVPSVSSCSPTVVSTASPKTYNTRSSTRSTKRKVPFDNTPTTKKIRCTPISKLIEEKTNVPATTVTQTNPVPTWPTPIVIKKEPDSNVQKIVHFSQSVPTQIKPNLPSVGYLIGNKVVPASTVIVSTAAVNNIYQVNGSGIVTTAAGNANGGNAGVRFLTLSNVSTTQSNCATSKKTILAQILQKPQLEPISVTSGPRVPPLVPITSKIGSKVSHLQTNGPISTNTVTVKEEIPEY